MNRYLPLIEESIARLIPDGRPELLYAAMRYAVGTGGKRVRPSICMAAAEAVGATAEAAVCPAVAIELLHNYTLVHDDLPSMDNDRLRRGKPTVWAKYGESTAVLAGDALLTHAFRIAARTPLNAGEIVRVLAERGLGVVAGQVEDLRLSGADGAGEDEARFVYERKTADLFVAAALTGALSGGADERQLTALGGFALDLGLAFQLQDDLIDGDGLFPPDKTAALAREKTASALAALESFGPNAFALRNIAEGLLGRKV